MINGLLRVYFKLENVCEESEQNVCVCVVSSTILTSCITSLNTHS